MSGLSIKLNKRITLRSLVAGQDANGEPTATLTDFATVWAEVKDVSGKEFLAAEATQNTVTTKMTIRHLAGVLPSMVVIYNTVQYKIQSVLGQDNRTLLLMCSRKA